MRIFAMEISPSRVKLPNNDPLLNFSTRSRNIENKEAYQWEIELLYDSHCPICMMEVEFLRKRDIHHKIRLTDLQSPDYDPADHGNVQFSEGMRKIRAVLPDQTVVMGVEVFRKTYEAIGLGWVFALTKLPFIGKFADNCYDLWAEHRLKLTGKGDLAQVLKDRADKLRKMGDVNDIDCEDACGIDYDDL